MITYEAEKRRHFGDTNDIFNISPEDAALLASELIEQTIYYGTFSKKAVLDSIRSGKVVIEGLRIVING